MFQMRDCFWYKTIYSAYNKQCREQSKLMLLANQNCYCLLIKIKPIFSERQVVFLQTTSLAVENDVVSQWFLRTRKTTKADAFFFSSRDIFLSSLHLTRVQYFYLKMDIKTSLMRMGGPESMENIVDQDEFVVEVTATHSEYLKKLPLRNLHRLARC